MSSTSSSMAHSGFSKGCRWEVGIEPRATLFHWDFPQALYRRVGCLNGKSPAWFARYATGSRTPKDSAAWDAETMRSNGENLPELALPFSARLA